MGTIRSQALRDAAEGEQCTLNIAGVCNYQPDTVCLAHLPDESKGMATKADDLSSCLSCSACHDVIDGRVKGVITPEEREYYMRRAMVRTWRRLLEKGVITIRGVKV